MSPDGKVDLGLIQFVLTPDKNVQARYWMERSEFDRINQEAIAAQSATLSTENEMGTEA